jgi:glutaminyl-peptide cyclotransferase
MMTADCADAIVGDRPAGRRWTLPHRLDRPRLGANWLWLVAIGGILALTWPVLSWLRAPMEDPEEGAAVAAAAAPRPAPIDGERAYEYLRRICALGPRPAGSEANARQRRLVADHFRALGGVVREQTFTARDPSSGATVTLVNLIGSWSLDRAQRVVLGAHYDTRPYPDLDPDPAQRRGTFLGANDGASGVALLMEIAHHLNSSPTPWGVDLVLFDAEELVYDQDGEYFLGSKEFGRRYRAERRSKAQRSRYVAGIVLDMVGDRDLDIRQEAYSLRFNRPLVRDLWTIARALGAGGFRNEAGGAVLDDHLALIDAGIPSVDLIDFNYPAWHTTQDLPERCSGASLAQVGRVVTAWLAKPKPRRR